IAKVTFTCESHEYWAELAKSDMPLVVDLYRDLLGDKTIGEGELVFLEDIYWDGEILYRRGDYNPWNHHNTTHGIVHLTAPVSRLGAAISQIALATIGRRDGGRELEDATRLLAACDPDMGAAGIENSADEAIVGVVGALARQRARITLRDPV